MKKASDDLFRLIKSMTKSEKGYYKKFAKKSSSAEESNFVVLFDAIDGLESFDEDLLKEKLEGTTVAKQLAVYKNYLYKNILKALHLFSYESSVTAQIREYINGIIILNQKGLFDQSRKFIEKIKKIAEDNELDLVRLEVLHLEKNLNMITEAGKDRYDSTIKNFEEEISVIEKIKNISSYLKLSNLALALVEKMGILRNKKDEEKFGMLFKDPLLSSEEKAPYHLSKILYNHVYANYYLAKSDIAGAYRHICRERDLIESRPEKIKINPKDYIYMLQNIMYLANELNLTDDVYEAIEKLRKLKESLGRKISRPLQVVIFARTANIELAMMLKNRKFEIAPTLIEETESSLKLYGNEIDAAEKLTIIYKIAYTYFIVENYSAALKWTNKIINSAERTAREDVLSFTHILNLVIHLELGNSDLLEYSIRSTYNFLMKRKKMYKVEQLFMKLLKDLLNFTGNTDIRNACSMFKAGLSKVIADPLEKSAFVYFDFNSWAESKITGKKMIDILGNKRTAHVKVHS